MDVYQEVVNSKNDAPPANTQKAGNKTPAGVA
jgi:hypothetical protein